MASRPVETVDEDGVLGGVIPANLFGLSQPKNPPNLMRILGMLLINTAFYRVLERIEV